MHVFLVIALIAALLHIVLGAVAWFLGSAVAYGIIGLLCGLVLRTRLDGFVRRASVVGFSVIGFAIAGAWDAMTLLAPVDPIEFVLLNTIPWALVGLVLSIAYLGWSRRLLVPLFAAMCFGAAGGLSRIITEWAPLLLWNGPVLVTIGAGIFDQICAELGLESPQDGFDRLRFRFEPSRSAS